MSKSIHLSDIKTEVNADTMNPAIVALAEAVSNNANAIIAITQMYKNIASHNNITIGNCQFELNETQKPKRTYTKKAK